MANQSTIGNRQSAIGVGVIGIGVMGGTHIGAYAAAEAAGYSCKVRAVCDIDPARLTGRSAQAGKMQVGAALFDPGVVKTYNSATALLADPNVDLVSICTPTPTHVEIASAALKAGKHVLIEKPVAITTEPVRTLREAERAAATIIMPAMCMRFWPAWAWLKDAIDSQKFGKLQALNLQRVGSLPSWSAWFADESQSGGAIVDLHIHDADFIHHAIGRPTAVTSAGHSRHISTVYHYDDSSLHVTAQGAWLAPGTPFRMRYIAEFEKATADFDIGRAKQLLLCREGASEEVDCGKLTGYDLEIRHILDAIGAVKGEAPAEPSGQLRPSRDGSAGTSPSTASVALRASLEDAIDVAIMLETEAYAAECGRRVTITWGVDEPH